MSCTFYTHTRTHAYPQLPANYRSSTRKRERKRRTPTPPSFSRTAAGSACSFFRCAPFRSLIPARLSFLRFRATIDDAKTRRAPRARESATVLATPTIDPGAAALVFARAQAGDISEMKSGRPLISRPRTSRGFSANTSP